MDDEDYGPAYADEDQGGPLGLSDHDLGRAAFEGVEALELERHPAFRSVVDGLSQSLFQQWAGTGLTDRDAREAIFLQHNALQMLAAGIAEKVRRGQAASDALRDFS